MAEGRWQRIGAVAGLLFVILIFLSFLTPSTPDTDASTSDVVSEVSAARTGLIFGVYVGSVAAAVFVLFAAGLWSLLQRGGAPGAALVTLVGAVLASAMVLVSDAILLALIYAAEGDAEPEAVRALFEIDNATVVPTFFALLVFHGAAAVGIVETRVLPPVLGWISALIALVYVVCLLGVFDADHDGGALGVILRIGFLVSFLWVLVTSVLMLRPQPAPPQA